MRRLKTPQTGRPALSLAFVSTEVDFQKTILALQGLTTTIKDSDYSAADEYRQTRY